MAISKETINNILKAATTTKQASFNKISNAGYNNYYSQTSQASSTKIEIMDFHHNNSTNTINNLEPPSLSRNEKDAIEKNIVSSIRGENDEYGIWNCVREYIVEKIGTTSIERYKYMPDSEILKYYYEFLGVNPDNKSLEIESWLALNLDLKAQVSSMSEEEKWQLYCSNKLGEKVLQIQNEKLYEQRSENYENFEYGIVEELKNNNSEEYKILRKKIEELYDVDLSKCDDKDLLDLFYKLIDVDGKNKTIYEGYHNPDNPDSGTTYLTQNAVELIKNDPAYTKKGREEGYWTVNTEDMSSIERENAWTEYCMDRFYLAFQYVLEDDAQAKAEAELASKRSKMNFFERVGSTVFVTTEKVGSGLFSAAEGLTDGIISLTETVGSGYVYLGGLITGNLEEADELVNKMDTATQDFVGESATQYWENKIYNSDIGENIAIGSYMNPYGGAANTIQGMSRMGGMIFANIVTGGAAGSSGYIGSGLSFLTEYGSSYEKAANEGATGSETKAFAFLNASLDAAFDVTSAKAINFGGKAQTIFSLTSGVATPWLNTANKYYTYAKDKSWNEVVTEEDTVKQSLTSLITLTGMSGFRKSEIGQVVFDSVNGSKLKAKFDDLNTRIESIKITPTNSKKMKTMKIINQGNTTNKLVEITEKITNVKTVKMVDITQKITLLIH